MRSVMSVLVIALVCGRPCPARATHTQAGELGLAVSSAVANVVYVPAKAVVALGGLFVGGLAGFLTGGDQRSAYALWVPAASGTYFLTPAHLEGAEPIEFFGSDYADRPSTAAAEAGGVYEAVYMSR
jgi:hypothetical protein